MLHNALTPASHDTYSRAVELYKKFVSDTLGQLVHVPFPPSQLLLFIAHCFSRGLAASTVYTYISAIGYYHKIRSVADPTNHFVIKKCMQGYRNKSHKGDKRLPITPDILRLLVASLVHTLPSHFERLLIKAMYLLAFHAFLRISEMTVSPHNLTFHQVRFLYTDKSSLSGCEVSICSFKHSNGKSQVLHVTCNNDNIMLCPVRALSEYCQKRGSGAGPLFSFLDHSPISRHYFISQLNLSLAWAGYSPDVYKTHSFRIGAATAAASMGVSEDKIQRMGRWSSNAFKKYIRIPVLKL